MTTVESHAWLPMCSEPVPFRPYAVRPRRRSCIAIFDALCLCGSHANRQVRETSTASATPVSTPVETVTVIPTPQSAATSIVAAQPTSPTTESSAWPWWLLVAALIAVAVAVPLLLAARRRRSSWNTQLTAATGEIVWFAGQLIPQLQRDGSRDQVAGAWQVTRARHLRDAVRDARTRIRRGRRNNRAARRHHDDRYALGAARAPLETALADQRTGTPTG